MAGIVQMYPSAEVEEPVQSYPPEQSYTRWGTGGSIGFHLLFFAVVLIVAYINHIRNLSDLLSSAVTAAMPPNQIEIILPPDDTPPPPTDHPQFIVQHIVTIVPPPPIPPKPKPKPKKPTPQPMIVQHTAIRQQAQQLQAGTGGLSQPTYPPDALHQRIQGTVVLKVGFDGSGHAAYCDIVSSSGSNILDDSARQHILDDWHEPSMANKTGTVPIAYRLR